MACLAIAFQAIAANEERKICSQDIFVVLAFGLAAEVRRRNCCKSFVLQSECRLNFRFTENQLIEVSDEYGQVNKSSRWMPWGYPAKKVVVSCEKSGGGANIL
jgi:hypothetical protein